MKKQPSGATFPITIVQLQNTQTGQVERWTMDKFQSVYAVMSQQHQEFKEQLNRGEEIDLPLDSPFKVNIHAQQSIGTASVYLQYIYFNMEMSETFSIISGVTGGPAGTVSLSMTPHFPTQEQRDAVDAGADTLHDVPELNYFDLEINISNCKGLPAQFASDVVIKFDLPHHVHQCLMPEGFDSATAPLLSAEETKALMKSKGKRGGSFETTVLEKNVDVLNTNPDIEYHRTLRLLNCDFRTLEWFKNASLILEVFGEPPNLELDPEEHKKSIAKMERKTKQANSSNQLKGSADQVGRVLQRLHGAVGKKDFNAVNKVASEVEAEVTRLAQEAASKHAESQSLSEQLDEATKRAKKWESREQERSKELKQKDEELKRVQAQMAMDQPALIADLQSQLKAAQEQAARDREALKNAGSSSCVVS
jgi:hypothetical protein